MKWDPMVPPAVRRGPVGSRRGPGEPEGPWECPVWVRTSIVHRYGTVERSVDRRAKTGFRRKPVRTRYDPTGPDGP